jgi:cytosine/adenosine deaminase-related metal-dependent hydrolase
MIVYRAAWICPIATAPLERGWVAVAHGRIEAVGTANEAPPSWPVRDLGRVVLLPGLVNAHTHLELSWLRDRVPPAATFVDWVKQLFLARGGRRERPDDPRVLAAARRAAAEARASGTAAVGDISNSLATVEPIRASGLRGVVFHELLGFNLPDGRSVDETRPLREAAARSGGEEVAVSIAPHAPYSVSAELFRAIHRERLQNGHGITSIHVGESDAEIAFLRDGSGPWPGILRWVGSARDGWVPPGVGPVEYLDALGVLDRRTLIVHGVQLDTPALDRLAERGCTLVTCPRSNQWVGAGVPPLERFYASGVPVAVGTDSLASVESLDMFAELKTMRWIAPSIPARRLLESATRVGAEALGLGEDLGTLAPGRRAALLTIELPEQDADSAHDVEEHLVSGIDPQRVRWVS